MKQFWVVFCGMCICSSSISMKEYEHYDFTFVNNSKSAYTIDASELKDAGLSREYYRIRAGEYKSAIEQIQIHPGRYLYANFFDEKPHSDHGRIIIKRNDDVVSALNIKVLKGFKNWKLILDNEDWWCRFSVNESMQAVIEKQIWGYQEHFIRIHDYNPEYRYSNQLEKDLLDYCLHWDGSEYPEPPANGDPRPQAKIPAMCYESVREDYLEEEYKEKSKKEGCLLL